MKKLFLGIVVISILVGILFILRKNIPTEKALGWSTYTNSHYGYSISYPGFVKVNLSSKINDNPTDIQKTDNFVVLLDKDNDLDEMSTITIIIYTENVSKNIKDLRLLFEKDLIPRLIEEDPTLSYADFKFDEVNFNEYPSLKISYPGEQIIELLNNDNQIIVISILNSIDPNTERSSKNKRLNTDKILATFKLL